MLLTPLWPQVAVAIGARHGYKVGSVPANVQRTLLELGELPCGADEVIARELIAWGIPLTPLMASTRVQADLAALTSAPGLDEMSRIMPHHARILRLRAPGGMAMGQREAMKHMGMVPLSKCDREVLAKGWALLRSVLGLVASSTWLVGGSGAPGLACIRDMHLTKSSGFGVIAEFLKTIYVGHSATKRRAYLELGGMHERFRSPRYS